MMPWRQKVSRGGKLIIDCAEMLCFEKCARPQEGGRKVACEELLGNVGRSTAGRLEVGRWSALVPWYSFLALHLDHWKPHIPPPHFRSHLQVLLPVGRVPLLGLHLDGAAHHQRPHTLEV